MNSIKIGNEERRLADVEEAWIARQIQRRRADGLSVCVRVVLDEGPMCIVLATPTCSGLGGVSRELNSQEQMAIELWERHHLNELDFSPGQVIAFVKQLRRLL